MSYFKDVLVLDDATEQLRELETYALDIGYTEEESRQCGELLIAALNANIISGYYLMRHSDGNEEFVVLLCGDGPPSDEEEAARRVHEAFTTVMEEDMEKLFV